MTDFHNLRYHNNVIPQFGTRHGIADVVLHQPVNNEQGRFVAIAECKVSPLPILCYPARAQLKSYMSATNTRYGVLAVGTDPRHWEFCENKYHSWFAEIKREEFEKGIENWKPVAAEAAAVNTRKGQGTARWWKRIALTLGVLFVVACASLLFLWPEPRDEFGEPTAEQMLYLVRETKSTTDLDELRPDEKRKKMWETPFQRSTLC